ncbi:hypothetical protein GTP23_11965 [Pseudoduganella sp. FT93W]|uniref:DUF2946 domain-containing protein n=1 Tax=Duganella fentianensis TaxID=2692177 RepID=A0A845HY14_9BURK|nr:hypothetical protein [Duganella fentianensis]MYN45762.1 hypothetical protein [Duganella fentianensis]
MLAMRPIFRFLLWLLIVALPLQGGAASMLPCVQLTPPVLHGSHCAAEGNAPQHLEQKKAQQHAHAKCSHCTACASVPGAPVGAELLLARLTGTVTPNNELAPPGHIPPALERPPRPA